MWETGLSRSSPSLTFQLVSELPSIAMVAAGDTHSAAIDTEGGLWVWTGKKYSLPAGCTPQLVEGLPAITKVACGYCFLVAEAEEGTLWVLGYNSEGQLGLGHTKHADKPTPVQVEGLSEGPLRCLAALHSGVILIDSQGGVFSSGNNEQGQLGRSSRVTACTYDSKLQQINNIPPMLKAYCGHSHTFSLDENGAVWSWGRGLEGQLGTGNTSNQLQPTLAPWLGGICELVASSHHSLAFPQDGGLLVFGSNCFGQLGLSHRINQPHPMFCPVLPAVPPSFTRKKKSARSA